MEKLWRESVQDHDSGHVQLTRNMADDEFRFEQAAKRAQVMTVLQVYRIALSEALLATWPAFSSLVNGPTPLRSKCEPRSRPPAKPTPALTKYQTKVSYSNF